MINDKNLLFDIQNCKNNNYLKSIIRKLPSTDDLNKAKQIKVLLLSQKYAYGDVNRKLSNEYMHLYEGLKSYFKDFKLFDYTENYNNLGKEKMQKKLQVVVESYKPEITIVVPISKEFDFEFISSLKKITKVFALVFDDTWRSEYVKKWAKVVDFFTYSDPLGKEKYEKIGLENGVYFPYACNTNFFNCHPKNNIRDIDVSFIGAWNPHRHWVINRLKKSGIKVETFGFRWKNGPVSMEEMLDIFSRSKISLNISNSVSWDARYFFDYPRGIVNSFRSRKDKEQVKARVFEICASGSMLMTMYFDGIENLYTPNLDVMVYLNIDDLVDKLNFFLHNSKIREEISINGYNKTIFLHDYGRAMVKLFSQLKWI